MVNFLKHRGCMAAAALLTAVSLSQAQTGAPNPAASRSVAPTPAENSPVLLVQAPAPAASPAPATATKTTGSAPTAAVTSEPDSVVESGGVGGREFQGDEVGQVLRLLARQAKINVAGSETVTGTVTLRLAGATAPPTTPILVKGQGAFM